MYIWGLMKTKTQLDVIIGSSYILPPAETSNTYRTAEVPRKTTAEDAQQQPQRDNFPQTTGP